LPRPQPPWTIQQAAFLHHLQNALAIYAEFFLPLHPPGDAEIAVGSFLAARRNDLLSPTVIGATGGGFFR